MKNIEITYKGKYHILVLFAILVTFHLCTARRSQQASLETFGLPQRLRFLLVSCISRRHFFRFGIGSQQVTISTLSVQNRDPRSQPPYQGNASSVALPYYFLLTE
ncbi:hypothetical protein SAY86_000245 [Trapa natans]|uniref:Uncharacterized protein n=1 Tax=Trapa natans TaxID=22666 RepID=A0AAN7MMS2_TRANT|nr:hypothetical protein SAY86_000245 [Trapa natans]